MKKLVPVDMAILLIIMPVAKAVTANTMAMNGSELSIHAQNLLTPHPSISIILCVCEREKREERRETERGAKGKWCVAWVVGEREQFENFVNKTKE